MSAAEGTGGDAASAGGLERVFLGWDAPALPRAAALLWERYGPDLRTLRVALPGRHAARRLEELLLDEAERRGVGEWWPPQIDTIGGATDQLIDGGDRGDDGEHGALAEDALIGGRHPVASSLARELAWLRVLQEAAPETLAALTPAAPQGEGLWALGQRLGLAELLRNLHSEVVGEALDFEQVAKCEAFPAHTREAARWRALAELQQAYRKLLAGERLEDPHLRRLDALREGRVHGEGTLVLLGVSELNRLQREILLAAAKRGGEVLALVVAPEAEAEAFEDLGTLRPEAWSARTAPLPDESWRITERPQDQAEEVVRALAELGAGRAVDEVVVCTARPELEPTLRRALTEAGSGLRSPVGPLLEECGPWKLLDALGDFLDTRSPESYGEILRHADFEAALPGGAGSAAIRQCDDYLLERLPARMPEGDALPHRERYRAMSKAVAFLDKSAGPLLAGTDVQSPPASADALRAFLERIYGARDFDRTREAERVCAAALEKLLAALDEVHRLPEGLARTKLRPTALLRVLLRRSAQQPVTPPQRSGTVEQLGWLDLPLDDAPVTVVSGVQQGAVPATRHGDAFLPDTLRAQLGMPEQTARDARDLHALCVLHHTRADGGGLRLIAGLQSPDGDPWLPSSLYFRCADAELAGRARAAFQDERNPVAAADEAPRAPYLPPLGTRWEEPAHHSASSLNLLLGSPYAWYLKYILRLEEADAPGHELDPMRFGNLLHKVLQKFGEDVTARDSEDPAEIRTALRDFHTDLAKTRFGGMRRASVALQLLHAERRLDRFAELQAEEARTGWRIRGAEWKPENDGVVEMKLGGQPLRLKGTLDRVERNELTGEWRVLDYKSGEQPRGKAQVYAPRKGEWKDVQLPLYRHLATAFPELRGEVRLGYFNLPKSPEAAGIWVGDAEKDHTPFDAGTLADADALVVEALSGMRAALEDRDESWFREVGSPREESLVAVLAGRSYLASEGGEDEDGDAGDGAGARS